MMDKCCNCKFYDNDGEGQGDCKFFPPMTFNATHERPDINFNGYWFNPKVHAGDWCGQFSPRLEVVQ